MFEYKNMYITETGALMSAHDYSFLSTDQQSKCKVYKMETNNKPDIIKFLCGELDYNGVWFGDAIAGKTFWWRSVLRDTIEERDAKIAEIEKENDQCKVYQRMNSLSHRKMVEDNAKLEDKVYKLEYENQALKSELDKAIELLKSIHDSGYGIGHFEPIIHDFLKDKR